MVSLVMSQSSCCGARVSRTACLSGPQQYALSGRRQAFLPASDQPICDITRNTVSYHHTAYLEYEFYPGPSRICENVDTSPLIVY